MADQETLNVLTRTIADEKALAAMSSSMSIQNLLDNDDDDDADLGLDDDEPVDETPVVAPVCYIFIFLLFKLLLIEATTRI